MQKEKIEKKNPKVGILKKQKQAVLGKWLELEIPSWSPGPEVRANCVRTFQNEKKWKLTFCRTEDGQSRGWGIGGGWGQQLLRAKLTG